MFCPGVYTMNCPLCQQTDCALRYRCPSHAVVRCSGCGLLYNRHFAAGDAQAQELFSESYYTQVQKEAFEYASNPARADASHRIYAEGLSVVEKAVGAGELLDVGCAFGSFLEFAQRRGWKVKGVEISRYASRFAREQRGLDVTCGTLASVPLERGIADLVTFWDVLEHTTDIRGNLARARDILRDGGHLLITTDNYQSFLALAAHLAYRATAGRWTYPVEKFFIPVNSCYFVPAILRAVLKDLGFEEVFFRGMDYPVEKINLSRAERILLRGLYLIGGLLKRNSQFLVVARKGSAVKHAETP